MTSPEPRTLRLFRRHCCRVLIPLNSLYKRLSSQKSVSTTGASLQRGACCSLAEGINKCLFSAMSLFPTKFSSTVIGLVTFKISPSAVKSTLFTPRPPKTGKKYQFEIFYFFIFEESLEWHLTKLNKCVGGWAAGFCGSAEADLPSCLKQSNTHYSAKHLTSSWPQLCGAGETPVLQSCFR